MSKESYKANYNVSYKVLIICFVIVWLVGMMSTLNCIRLEEKLKYYQEYYEEEIKNEV